MIIDDYLSLITTEHSDKPKFVDTVSSSINVAVYLQNLLSLFPEKFDVDTAIGYQLDTVGEWVGRSRRIASPISGVYFSWDVEGVGWEQGVWKGPFDPDSGIVDLPDDSYRLLLKAKIAANNWDGTIPGAYSVWEKVFTGSYIVIQDNQNMTMIVGISGSPLSLLEQELLAGGYIPLKPEGVNVTYNIVPEKGKLFGWDLENDVFAGWDEGLWPIVL